jgi:DNA-binding CsgD family transcriptional regulator
MNVLDICESLLAVNTASELNDVLRSAAGVLDCQTYSGFYVPKPSLGAREPKFSLFGNVDPRYESFLDVQACKTDPVMQFCKSNSLPIRWGQENYVRSQQGHMHEEMAYWGMRSGIAIGLHQASGSHFSLGFDSPERWQADDQAHPHRVAAFSLVSAHAQVAAETCRHPLTSREVDVLQWTAAGKTASEVGTILSISEKTVTKHVANAAAKLDCYSKHQAVIRAIRLGLVAA